MPQPGLTRGRTVNGKWFIPTIFVAFVLFTLAMSFGTVFFGKTMRPSIERRQIESQKAEMEREARIRQVREANR